MTLINTDGTKRLSDIAKLTKELSEEDARLVLSIAKVNKEDQKSILIKNGVIASTTADKVATDADTISKYENLKVTNMLKVAWGKLSAFALANPWIVAAVAGAAAIGLTVGAVDLFTESLDEAQDKAEKSKQSYDELASELSTLEQEFKTSSDRIKELQQLSNNGTITLVEQNELDKLKETNEELEREIRLKEHLAEKSVKQASDDAVNAITNLSETHIYYSTGDTFKQDRIDAFQSKITEATELQNKLNDAIEKQKQIEADYGNTEDEYSNDSEWKNLQSQIDVYKYDIEVAESAMEKYYNELSEEDDALRDRNNNIIEGAEETVARLESVYNGFDLYNSGGKTVIDKVEDFFNDEANESSISKLQSAFSNYVDGNLNQSSLYTMTEFKKVMDSTGISAITLEQYLKDLYDVKQDLTTNSQPDISFQTISQTVDNINTKLKPTLDSLASAYKDIFTDDGFTLDNVGVDMLQSVKEEIDSLNEIDGINIPVSSFENFAKVLSDTSSTSDQVHDQFNQLADTIVDATGTAKLSSENFEVLVMALERLGLTNARERLTQIKIAQEELESQGYDLLNITNEEIRAFLAEGEASEFTAEYLKKYTLQKVLDNPLDTSKDIENLEDLCDALGVTGEMLIWINQIKNAQRMIDIREATGFGAPIEAMEAQINTAKEEMQKILDGEYTFEFEFDGSANISSDSSSTKSSKSSTKDTKETFDWIETTISRIQRTITNLGKTVSATYKQWSTRNNALAQEMAEVNKKINAQMTAYNAYMAEANKIDLDERYKKLVRDGDYSIAYSDNEKLNEKIDLYKEW